MYLGAKRRYINTLPFLFLPLLVVESTGTAVYERITSVACRINIVIFNCYNSDDCGRCTRHEADDLMM